MNEGRTYHEKVVFQQDALALLRTGHALTDVVWKERHPGSRIAQVVDKLRNAHGFTIEGDGSVASPYLLPDVYQLPGLVAVTDEMKAAYYESGHWRELSRLRREKDDYRCIICGSDLDLAVHHIIYELFNEHIDDLMTVCGFHHDRLHRDSRLKFPSWMTVNQADSLGVEWRHAEWLLPKFALHN